MRSWSGDFYLANSQLEMDKDNPYRVYRVVEEGVRDSWFNSIFLCAFPSKSEALLFIEKIRNTKNKPNRGDK